MKTISSGKASELYSMVWENVQSEYNLPIKMGRLRIILEDLFTELVSDEKWFNGTDLYGMNYFIFDNYNPPDETKHNVNSLRWFSNQFHHSKPPEVTQQEYRVCVKMISSIIQHFSKSTIPDEIQLFYSDVLNINLKGKPVEKKEHIPFFTGIIRDIKEPRKQNNTLCSLLSCISDDTETVGINCWDDKGTGIGVRKSEMSKLSQKYNKLNIFNIVKVPTQNKDRFYSTTPDSMVVLDPDFLIDVTSIAECFTKNGPYEIIYLIDKFRQMDTSKSLVIGNIVNTILDTYIRNPRESVDSLFTEAMKECAFDVLYLAHNQSGFNSSIIDEIKKEAFRHFETIKSTISSVSKKTIETEPFFISPLYGISGRLDVLLNDENERKDIIELKTGSCPWNAESTWSNHAIQVHCYDLLLESAFGNREGGSSILYSRASRADNPIRYVQKKTENQQDVMMLRNRLIAIENRVAQRELEELLKENHGNIDHLGYNTAHFQDLISVLENATELEKEYFLCYCSFVAREHRAAKTGSVSGDVNTGKGFSSLWLSDREQKSIACSILDNLMINKDRSDIENSVFSFDIDQNLFKGTYSTSNFRQGDICLLYAINQGGDDVPEKRQLLKGSITEIKPEKVTVQLRNKNINKNILKGKKSWTIEHDFMDSSFKDHYRSLFKFLRASPDSRNLLLGKKKPTFDPLKESEYRSHTDRDIDEILRQALSARDYFLIQGPPGTGKTSIALKEIVSNLYNETDENVIVAAFTNRAVDEICERLIDAHVPFMRLGSRGNENHNSFRNLAHAMPVEKLYDEFINTRIYVTTVSSLFNFQLLFRMKHFATAVIDEASQLLEPHLVGILIEFDRFILIGDEKQLPAVVMQSDKHLDVKSPVLNEVGINNYSDSLFERLLAICKKNNWHDAYGMLIGQGRMHEDIMEFVNREYYDGRLRTLLEKQKERKHRFDPRSKNEYERIIASSRIVFYPTERDKNHTKINENEASTVVKFVKAVIDVYGADFNEDTLGIITPYRAQIAAITSLMYHNKSVPEHYIDKIMVDTVERFQGSQRDIIIVSFAVNHVNQLKFLSATTPDGKVDRKLNVTLTRAKSHLVLLGCPDVLCHNEHYHKLLAFLKEKGSYFSGLLN